MSEGIGDLVGVNASWLAELQRENERLQAELSALRSSVRQQSVRATEQQLREMTAERDRLKGVLVDVEHLARFLALAWWQADNWVVNHFTAENCGGYPMVQGTKNQNDLRKLAANPYHNEHVRRAVDFLLDREPTQ